MGSNETKPLPFFPMARVSATDYLITAYLITENTENNAVQVRNNSFNPLRSERDIQHR